MAVRGSRGERRPSASACVPGTANTRSSRCAWRPAHRRWSPGFGAAGWWGCWDRRRGYRRPGGRLVAARLIRRLHGVHRVEFAVAEIVGRRDIAALRESRRFVQGRALCVRGLLEPRQIMSRGILLEYRDGRLRRRRIGIGIFRRAGTDQVLVIQERTAECALEKIIGEHEFLGESRTARSWL